MVINNYFESAAGDKWFDKNDEEVVEEIKEYLTSSSYNLREQILTRKSLTEIKNEIERYIVYEQHFPGSFTVLILPIDEQAKNIRVHLAFTSLATNQMVDFEFEI